MNFFHDLKELFVFPNILQVAQKELAQAELDLLKAETGLEFADSLVEFNKRRVIRLRSWITRKHAGLI